MAGPRRRPFQFAEAPTSGERAFEAIAALARLQPALYKDRSALQRESGIEAGELDAFFRHHAQESPSAFLRRARVEHAYRLLRQGAAPTGIARHSAFEGLASLEHDFLRHTGLSFVDCAALAEQTSFSLRLPPLFRFRTVLNFYARDSHNIGESVSAAGLRKCLLLDDRPAVLDIRFTGDRAFCESDAANPFAAHQAVVRMLGLGSDAEVFERQFGLDPLLGPSITRQRGLHVPLTPDPWEALAWAIIGQQINLPFAVSLRRALLVTAGPLHSSGLRAHPSPARVAEMTVDQLRALRFSGSKAEYLLAAARAVANGEVPLHLLRDLSASHAARLLGSIRGVGPWTVQYALLRGLGYPDCLPAGDAGLAQGLGRLTGRTTKQNRPKEPDIHRLMARFSPYRSLATGHVWAGLQAGEAQP